MSSENPSSGYPQAENVPSAHETLPQKVCRLKNMYPGRLTLTDLAHIFGVTKGAVVKYHQHRIPYLQVEGIKLFDEKVVHSYAKARRRNNVKSQLRVVGIEVERLQQICVTYYRQNLDIGPPELLTLAKRIGRL